MSSILLINNNILVTTYLSTNCHYLSLYSILMCFCWGEHPMHAVRLASIVCYEIKAGDNSVGNRSPFADGDKSMPKGQNAYRRGFTPLDIVL